MDCFVAGIVKGLVERNDPYAHFGSLMAFQGHKANAINAGYVVADTSNEPWRDKLLVTPKGRQYYKHCNLEALEQTRAYMWPKQDWTMPGPN